MSAASSKRRRDADSGDDNGEMHQERKKVKSLPFRTSPTSKQYNLYSQHHCFPPQTLAPARTPVDSSDDEQQHESEQLPFLEDSNTSSDSSDSSITVLVGDDDDMDMADLQPRQTSSPTHPLQRRSRSNDMLAPPQFPHLLHSQAHPNGGRVATPIYRHFINPDVNLIASNHRPGSSAPLSPFIYEEEELEWWRRRRLPSPNDDLDEPNTPMGGADGMMDTLSINPSDLDGTTTSQVPVTRPECGLAIFQRRTQPDGQNDGHRSTRLAMGYRADCEKCVHRVPGHYSHIVRG